MVRALGLHTVALGSNSVLTPGQDLLPVVPDSTLPRLVNSQPFASLQLGVLIYVSVEFKLFLSDY